MEKKSIFLTEPAWLLAISTSIVALLSVFIFAHLFGAISTFKMSDDTGLILVYGLYGIIVVLTCFMICKYHPKSIWYSVILCNVTGIFPATGEESFWSSNLWILFIGIWIFSIVGGIIGVVIGKRHT